MIAQRILALHRGKASEILSIRRASAGARRTNDTRMVSPLPFDDDYSYLNLLTASTPSTTVPAINNSTFGITDIGPAWKLMSL